MESEPSCKLLQIPFSEILRATNNFDENLVIWRNHSAKVYKGIDSERPVAIKRLNPDLRSAESGFWTEIELLSRYRHPNLVSLVGYCHHEKQAKMCSMSWPCRFVSVYETEMILVYDYVSNGTLNDHLHVRPTDLSWTQRLRICIGAARGLTYLHESIRTETRIIHRDIKSSNILLDSSWEAKISQFGLSAVGTTNDSSPSVKGTYGYMDPEYLTTGMITQKSDVYAFGVVLFEVLSGRLAMDKSHHDKQRTLVSWVHESLKERNLEDLIDLDIRNEVTLGSLQEFSRIAMGCLLEQPKSRPRMAEVIGSLESALRLQERSDKLIYHTLPFPSDGQNSAQCKPKTSSNNTKFLEGAVGSGSPNRIAREFTFAELREATRGFSSDLVLGVGGFGKVYKGWIDAKQIPVAVKRLNQEGLQGHTEFQRELTMLSRVVHPNIIALLGYCEEEAECLLVYEYMPNKSLDSFLFLGDAPKAKPLSWGTRHSILIGAARGLAYLHSCNFVHRDIKASNILLDVGFEAKLKGFVLSEYMTETGEMPMGTPGYVDPAYWMTGCPDVKSDVYGFGVLLLECLTGRRAYDDGKHSLVEWSETNRKEVKKVMDPHLEHNYPEQGASKWLALALRCVAMKPEDRPSSEELLRSLEQIGALYKC